MRVMFWIIHWFIFVVVDEGSVPRVFKAAVILFVFLFIFTVVAVVYVDHVICDIWAVFFEFVCAFFKRNLTGLVFVPVIA